MSEKSTEISKWSDSFMFKAEPSLASAGPSAHLLGGPVDPLGQIAAAAKMYKGEVVRDLADVTDEERMSYLEEIQKTVLKMPLESVPLHFMVEGVHRGITHQMVRQRTAAFAQESTRFAVKEDLAEAVALPPSLMDTLSFEDAKAQLTLEWRASGILKEHEVAHDDDVHDTASRLQTWRFKWDSVVARVGNVYNELINDGMPAEDARGLMPTNITTRLNYITNLRSFYDTMAVRVSDQAQFEWRMVAMVMAKAMITYGEGVKYDVWMTKDELMYDQQGGWGETKTREDGVQLFRVRKSSAWQWKALAQEIKPIEFKIGGPAFGANFDRPSRIGERVAAFHKMGVPSSEWTIGSVEHSIPPIRPEEWLMDPKAARLDANEEFDVFGNRVTKGTGAHWKNGQIVTPNGRRGNWAPVKTNG